MKYFRRIVRLVSLISLLLCATSVFADSLTSGFQNPPPDARPRTWWHWISGNVTREGITADLEAMKNVGLGGATILDIDGDIPHGEVNSLSPEWFALINHAIREANRLGLEITVHNCPGWSSSGGPWIKPENAMKEIRYTETFVEGGKPLDIALKQPSPGRDNKFYRDVAVLAFPSIAGDGYDIKLANPKLTSNLSPDLKLPSMPDYIAVTQDLRDLLNWNWQRAVIFHPLKNQSPSFVTYEFPEPFTAGSFRIGIDGPPYQNSVHLQLSTSQDGINFSPFVNDIQIVYPGDAISFPRITAKFFRVSFLSTENDKFLPLHGLTFSPGIPLSGIKTKAFYVQPANREDCLPKTLPALDADCVIAKKSVVNLTEKMDASGQLSWDPPPGKWTILRFGYVAIGTDNHPVNPEAKGLECDKMSKAGVDAAWSGMMAKIVQDAGGLTGKSLTSTLIDSYEVGVQNWTDEFPAEFKRLRGYDLLDNLPILTGRHVESAEYSERFLQDFRRTISDLFAEYYGGYFADLAHKNKMQLIVEPYGGPFDDILQGSFADIPMGEFWSSGPGVTVSLPASIAHVTGKKIVEAESFTTLPGGQWKTTPSQFKARGDEMFAEGVNRFVFHSFAHQPWHNATALMTMGCWGFDFNRKNTLWNGYAAWVDYITRSQYLLQQGNHVADVLYVAPELVPSPATFKPDIPFGYAGNCIESSGLEKLTVQDRCVVTPSGMSCPLLIVNHTSAVSVTLLQHIKTLVENGANVLLGERPSSCIGLADYSTSYDSLKSLSNDLWADLDGKQKNELTLGKGRVFFGVQPDYVLGKLKCEPDFRVRKRGNDMLLKYIHRKTETEDIYFISNQSPVPTNITFAAAFRISGRVPEIWNAENGMISDAPVYQEAEGKTVLPLSLENSGSIFIVFRRPSTQPHLVEATWSPTNLAKATAYDLIQDNGRIFLSAPSAGMLTATAMDGKAMSVTIPEPPPAQDISDNWRINFPTGLGAPDSLNLPKLASLSEQGEDGVKYFSGTTTYRRTFSLDSRLVGKSNRTRLNLGEVGDLAQVIVNGKNFGTYWHSPYSVDITDALKPGENQLEIRVSNRWINRLIGDDKLPPDCEWNQHGELGGFALAKNIPNWVTTSGKSPTGRITFSPCKAWKGDTPLSKSGLMGPVELSFWSLIEVK